MAAKSVKTKFVTGKVRFSFVHVFEPAETLNGTLKYSASILIPKTDKDTVARFNKAFEDTKQANAAYFGGSIPKVLKGGLRDGDVEKDDPIYAGHYFFNANSNEKPGIVDADVNPIIDKNEFYSGCYGRASITMYPGLTPSDLLPPLRFDPLRKSCAESRFDPLRFDLAWRGML